MMQKAFRSMARVSTSSAVRPSPLLVRMATSSPAFRSFGHTKYAFDDEDFDPNVFQLSATTHQSNAEELINRMPIVEVHGSVVRCTGVQELGLGHPV